MRGRQRLQLLLRQHMLLLQCRLLVQSLLHSRCTLTIFPVSQSRHALIIVDPSEFAYLATTHLLALTHSSLFASTNASSFWISSRLLPSASAASIFFRQVSVHPRGGRS